MKIKRKILNIALAICISSSLLAITEAIKNKKMYENQLEITEKEIENSHSLREDLNELMIKIDELEQENYVLRNQWRNLGIFKITYYCDCEICQENFIGTTALGNKPTANKTIAVDPNVIALGSKVKINNHEYIAEDTGGAIKSNKIDIFVSTHQEAIEKGIDYVEVRLKI